MGQEPASQQERDLATALEESQCIVTLQKDVMVGMQAQTVLHSMYVEGLHQQLQGKEDKEKTSKITGRINMDGCPKVITQDFFFKAMQDHNMAQEAAVEATGKRKDAWARYTDTIAIWKVRDMDRKDGNAALKEEWSKDVKRWEVERDSAKFDCRKARWTKPKMPAVAKAIRKLKISDFVEGSKDDEASDNEESEELMGSDSD